MPTVILLGEPCRVRPMLDAIGAQEALEAFKAPHVCHGARRAAHAERERNVLARRRNAAEKKLRLAEHRAWRYWCAHEAERPAIYAVLTDLPTKEEWAGLSPVCGDPFEPNAVSHHEPAPGERPTCLWPRCDCGEAERCRLADNPPPADVPAAAE